MASDFEQRTEANPRLTYLRVFRDGHGLTPREKNLVLERIKALENIIAKKATIEEIAKAFRMLSSVMILTNSLTEESTEGYLLSLMGYSSYTIKKMMFDHLKGRTPSKDKRFLPPAPELANYCDQVEAEINKAAHKLRYYANLQTYSQALNEPRR